MASKRESKDKELEKVKKEKTKKIKKQKKNETIVFVNTDEEAEKVLNEVIERPIETEKKNNFWSEVKSFFLIILIIASTIGIGFFIYKYVKPFELKDKNKKEETQIVETSDYKTLTYTSLEERSLKLYGNKYLVEYKDNTLYKVLDIDGNILLEGKEEYTNIYVGIDDELYLSHVLYDKNNKVISTNLYRIKNKQLEEVLILDNNDYVYTTLLFTDNKTDKLLGIVGESSTYDNEKLESKSILYTLDKKSIEVLDVRFTGDSKRTSATDPIYTYSDNYIVVKDTNTEYQYGVYDIKNEEMIVNTKYDGLYTTLKGDYIAIKDKKVGIINVKSKILLDFKYDYINDSDNFYVIVKNNKLGIIDNEFNEVIKPTFSYQQVSDLGFSYNSCGGAVNTFKAIKYKDKYILTINEGELVNDIDYKLHETYVIDNAGEYLTIVANEFKINDNFIYAYDKENKKYTIYDNNFAERYVIDISDYDFEQSPSIYLVNENTIVVSLDTKLYFDYLTGEEIPAIKDATLIVDKIEFKYVNENSEVTVKVNGKVVGTYKYKPSDKNTKFYMNISDKVYYYVSSNSYLMVRKSD